MRDVHGIPAVRFLHPNVSLDDVGVAHDTSVLAIERLWRQSLKYPSTIFLYSYKVMVVTYTVQCIVDSCSIQDNHDKWLCNFCLTTITAFKMLSVGAGASPAIDKTQPKNRQTSEILVLESHVL